IPKGLARKFVPKFIGSYKVLKDFENNSYQLDLPSNAHGWLQWFGTIVMDMTVPNDDWLFPRCLDNQIWNLDDTDHKPKWAIDIIKEHSRSKKEAHFLIQWKAGNSSWLPYDKINHLNALQEYFDKLGI
ncbi:hypothetical protein BDQ17DRAFT_1174064, partial [Cyathus striatus]